MYGSGLIASQGYRCWFCSVMFLVLEQWLVDHTSWKTEWKRKKKKKKENLKIYLLSKEHRNEGQKKIQQTILERFPGVLGVLLRVKLGCSQIPLSDSCE